MYPRLRPPSDSLELADRPETDDTEDAVETERSSSGTAPSAREGTAHGSGDPARSRVGEGVVSIAAVDRRGVDVGGGGCDKVLKVKEWYLLLQAWKSAAEGLDQRCLGRLISDGGGCCCGGRAKGV